MDRVFLDANVLFSAAYSSENRLRSLWSLTNIQLLTCDYALEEARRNLSEAGQLRALSQMAAALEIIVVHFDPQLLSAENNLQLPEKDIPIILGAIQGNATHLLTGDVKHFGHLMEQIIHGITILKPAQYLRINQG